MSNESRGGCLAPIILFCLLPIFVLLVFGAQPKEILRLPLDIFTKLFSTESLDLKELLKQEDSKPKPPSNGARIEKKTPDVVTLKADLTFPTPWKGKVVGSVKVPKGSVVKIKSVEGNLLTLEYNESRLSVPAAQTDFTERTLAMNR